MRLGVSSEVSVPAPCPKEETASPAGWHRGLCWLSPGAGGGGGSKGWPGLAASPFSRPPRSKEAVASQTSPKIGNSEEDGERGPRKGGHWWHHHPEPMTPTLLGVVWPDRGDPEGSLALCGRDHPVREQKALSLLSKSPWAMRPVSPPVESRDLRSGPCALVLAATAPTH